MNGLYVTQSTNLTCLCPLFSNNAIVSNDCRGECQHTGCSACYFQEVPRCQKCARNDFKCLAKFAKCTKKTTCTRNKYPCKKKLKVVYMSHHFNYLFIWKHWRAVKLTSPNQGYLKYVIFKSKRKISKVFLYSLVWSKQMCNDKKIQLFALIMTYNTWFSIFNINCNSWQIIIVLSSNNNRLNSLVKN